ncbi:MAG TPA: hypothetical protein VLA04_05555 [Verrucomicrobiae bacterium]|nr:hypothetical protein [Verrucomicrobiae bacterium]
MKKNEILIKFGNEQFLLDRLSQQDFAPNVKKYGIGLLARMMAGRELYPDGVVLAIEEYLVKYLSQASCEVNRLFWTYKMTHVRTIIKGLLPNEGEQECVLRHYEAFMATLETPAAA